MDRFRRVCSRRTAGTAPDAHPLSTAFTQHIGERVHDLSLASRIMMLGHPEYALEPPATDAEWAAYHDIRRRVLFELRGHVGVYDAQHPDERRPENHPLLLTHDGAPVGVIRVDLAPGRAIFRRVAVREDVQRRGHGRVLLALAEAFVRGAGGTFIHIQSYVDPEAVGFYERCGFIRHDPRHASVDAAESTVLMIKDVREPTE